MWKKSVNLGSVAPFYYGWTHAWIQERWKKLMGAGQMDNSYYDIPALRLTCIVQLNANIDPIIHVFAVHAANISHNARWLGRLWFPSWGVTERAKSNADRACLLLKEWKCLHQFSMPSLLKISLSDFLKAFKLSYDNRHKSIAYSYNRRSPTSK